MNYINLRVFSPLFCVLLTFSFITSVTAAPPKDYFGGVKYSKYILRLYNGGHSTKYKITVKPAKVNFEPNTAVNIRVTIINDSNQDIYLESDLARIKGIEIKIRDSKGDVSELLDKWKKKYGEPGTGSRIAIQILPGEEYSYQINLRQFYKLSLGIYEVTVIHPIIINELDKRTSEKKEIKLKAKPVTLVIN